MRAFVHGSDEVRRYPAGPHGLMLHNGCVSEPLHSTHISLSVDHFTLVSGHTWFCWLKSSDWVKSPSMKLLTSYVLYKSHMVGPQLKLYSSLLTGNNIRVRGNLCLFLLSTGVNREQVSKPIWAVCLKHFSPRFILQNQPPVVCHAACVNVNYNIQWSLHS